MREILLTGECCPDKESLHRYLAEQLQFPEWYGNNLDALHDCLTDIREDISIVVPNVDDLEEKLDAYARRLMRLLVEVSGENPHIHLSAE